MAQKFQIVKNVLLFLNILGLGAISYFTWTQTNLSKERPEAKAIVEEFFDKWEESKGLTQKGPPGEILKRTSLPLEVFVANLSQVDEESYHITFYPVLTFAKDDEVSQASFTSHLPLMRDRIIELINSKTKDEVLKAGGKALLKDELKATLNILDLPYLIEEVFFTGFIVK